MKPFNRDADMPIVNSDDYHDYVFKDGKLIGEFEQMYQKSNQISWHQDKDPDRLDCKIALNILETRAPYQSILDVGCGLGYFTNEISKFCKEKRSTFGIDISPAAVRKAQKLFPRIRFEVLDISEDLMNKTGRGRRSYDLVIVRGLFWYVFPKIKKVCQNIVDLIDKKGYILVQQNFPPPNSNFVGKEVLPNPETLLSYFKSKIDEIVVNYLEDNKQNQSNDNWIYMFGVKK